MASDAAAAEARRAPRRAPRRGPLGRVHPFALGALVLSAAAAGGACRGELSGPPGLDCSSSPGDTYERRIAPLLEAERPNLCAQCHAGGSVDLASFLRPDPCESLACLEAQGLADLEHPERSVLLRWIERAVPRGEGESLGGAGGEPGGGPASPLITQAIIDEERQGFLEWFRHESTCRTCADVACPDAQLERCATSDTLPAAYDRASDPGDCERETLERLFRGTIYEWRGRCYPCHFEGTSGNEDAPRWASDRGSCQVAALNTQNAIVDAGYLDTAEPSQSLLVLKPLALADGGVVHGGHEKFTQDDASYADFVYWITRYAECEAP